MAIGYKQVVKQTYCSRSCASKANADPIAAAVRAREQMKDPALRAMQSKRMKKNNPMKDPEVKARMMASMAPYWEKNTFLGERGGNGNLTPQQETLANALGEPWVMEHPIPTGNPHWRAAMVDIAHPERKIAIEVDGNSHHSKKQKNRDKRKAAMLAEQGWTLLRFWNSEVDESLDEVLATIAKSSQ
jgi:hypothetical protein